MQKKFVDLSPFMFHNLVAKHQLMALVSSVRNTVHAITAQGYRAPGVKDQFARPSKVISYVRSKEKKPHFEISNLYKFRWHNEHCA